MMRMLSATIVAVLMSTPGIAADEKLPLPVENRMDHRQIPHETTSIYVDPDK